MMPRILERLRTLRIGAAAPVVAAGLALALYWESLTLWWALDDSFLLRLIANHSMLEYFVDAGVWRSLPFKMFTPLQMASWELDASLFGLSPVGFYWHHLLLIATAAALLFVAASLWLPRVAALGVAVLFLLGPSLVSWTQQLMLRHYLEGLCLALASAVALVWGVRGESRGLLLASALLYLLAMLAKECYVPAIALLAASCLVTEVTLRSLRFHLASLIVYLLWRLAMIGTLLGGYGFAPSSRELFGLALALPRKLVLANVGGGIWIAAGVVAAFVAGIAFGLRWRGLLVLLVALFVASAPFVPVSTQVEDRYAVLFWLAVSAGFVAALVRIHERGRSRAAVALFAIAAAGSAIANRTKWNDGLNLMRTMALESRFVVETMSATDVLRNPHVPPASLGDFQVLAPQLAGRASQGSWFYDDVFLCGSRDRRHRYWEARGLRMVDVTGEVQRLRRTFCSGIRQDAPLELQMDYADGNLRWELGPYRQGQYKIILSGGRVAHVLPRAGQWQFVVPPAPLRFRLGYTDPAGWVTYSPELTLALPEARSVRWSRKESS